MKNLTKAVVLLAAITLTSCQLDDILGGGNGGSKPIKFSPKQTIAVSGEGSSEISAYDAFSKTLFITNADAEEITVYNIADLNNPQKLPSIATGGVPNSVATHNGKLAICVENADKQAQGSVILYDALKRTMETFQVGSLPDMVAFSKDGRFIVTANEGEPNDDYTIDPLGTISVIDLQEKTNDQLSFLSFVGQENALIDKGFRIFGEVSNIIADIEPEYVTISDDSKTAWVSLQENNGIAKVDLISKTITDIFPLGYKDMNDPMNSFDASNKDNVKELKNWPVKGIYQPDGLKYVNINGQELVISANEGDARDYDGYSEEKRIAKIKLDETAFPNAEELQKPENLGRLKITTQMGDTDGDGDFDELYAYGGRSFSIWNANNGSLVHDSGNSIAKETLAKTPGRFNDNDKRSDDKGAEPEAVEVLKIDGKYILFVGLERNDQVLMYDITNPSAPVFMDILANVGDEAPEGLIGIPAKDSPTGKDLVVVTNEVSGTVTFYEKN